MFRKLVAFMLGGALLGVVVASLAGPSYLAWDNTPAFGQALCNCTDCVKQTAARLIQLQLIGGAVGMVSLLLLGAVMLRSLGKRKKPAEAPPSSGTP